MTAIRHNFSGADAASQQARSQFMQGIQLLDREPSGISSADIAAYLDRQTAFGGLGLTGDDQALSTYDLFVLWHVMAMARAYQVGNAAHGGPIFLPWHRMYLIRLEQQLQRVLNDPDFGIPYWDWAADGELSPPDQRNTSIWGDNGIGESRGQVQTGGIADVQVRIMQLPGGPLQSIGPRSIIRNAGVSLRVLPDKQAVQGAVDAASYAHAPWGSDDDSHRYILEVPLHNRVHGWVGADMTLSSSPNDPIFFLHHCNVDRIWEAWMMAHGRDYQPQVGDGPDGHHIDEDMLAILGEALQPIAVIDPAVWYQYDQLN